MPDFKKMLATRLNGFSEQEKAALPSGYQSLGHVAVLNLKPELLARKSEIGAVFLQLFPRFKTVCARTGEIIGLFREPQLEVIAGEPNTEVQVVENGVKYSFDCARLMFAKGNVSERARFAEIVGEREIVVDMFAGIGYFTLPMAVSRKPRRIYAIELNPVAFEYLQKNIELNKVSSIVDAINGDCAVEVARLVEQGVVADRVVMGYLPAPKEQLPAAIAILKKGGMLHYEGVTLAGSDAVELLADVVGAAAAAVGRKVELVNLQRVKSYGPKKEHVVLDCRVD